MEMNTMDKRVDWRIVEGWYLPGFEEREGTKGLVVTHASGILIELAVLNLLVIEDSDLSVIYH